MEIVHLEHIDGLEFEHVCKKIFERAGVGHVQKIGGVADGGRDLVIHQEGGSIIVECKHYLNSTVGRPVVQKLHSAVISNGAREGIIATTGKFSDEAIQHANALSNEIPIRLYDLHKLNDLAQRAGIRLVLEGEENTLFATQMSDIQGLAARFLESLKNLESFPDGPGSLFAITPRQVVLEPCYMLKVDIRQDFKTSLGLVHSINERNLNVIFDRDGQHIKGVEFLNGTVLVSVSDVTRLDCAYKRGEYVLDTESLKTRVVDQMIREYTRVVRYMGKTRRVYTKECKPGPSAIHIGDLKQVFIPICTVLLSFVHGTREYLCEIIEHNGGIRVLSGGLTECGICKDVISDGGLLCNVCGVIVHRPKLIGSESHRCKECNKTICKHCTFWFRKFAFKKMICEDCADLRPDKKHKLVQP